MTRALIVEDEVLVAMLLEEMLLDLGHAVGAVSSHLDEAVALAAQETFDFAVLDINLNGKKSFPVADVLAARGVPFLFATGYGARALMAPWLDRPILQKPYSLDELRRALGKVGIGGQTLGT
ncbi:MAG: response regulator [Alphaproteobacteria bacterium]|nr:response regulator [Alphaproteobacteria bacterium]